MRIALLYSGAIRTLPETLENNLKCFSFADVDLYLHTWEENGYSNRINSPDYILGNRNGILDYSKFTYIKEKYKDQEFKLINGLDNQGLASQYYKIYKSFCMIEDVYDAVARIRCDIIFDNFFTKEYLESILKEDKIIFPDKIWYNHTWNPNIQCMNEMFFISNYKNMKKACNIYNNSEKINKIINSKKMTDPNFGESICYMNLEAENLLNKISTYNLDYKIIR